MPDLHFSERDDQVFPELFREKTAKPAVGTWVRLTINNSYSANIFKHNFYRVMGRVTNLPMDRYPADAFGLFVADDAIPQRVILLRNVYSINGVRVRFVDVPKALSKPQVVRTFSITGSKGDVYSVETMNGNWSCTCKGYSFRRTCAHISQAAARLTELQAETGTRHS